jgi:hypothetical protein
VVIECNTTWLWMNRKMIGEAIYIRVSDRKWNPTATIRGNVPTQIYCGKSAVFLMESTLTSHGSSKLNKKPSDGRGISDYITVISLKLTENIKLKQQHTIISQYLAILLWIVCARSYSKIIRPGVYFLMFDIVCHI